MLLIRKFVRRMKDRKPQMENSQIFEKSANTGLSNNYYKLFNLFQDINPVYVAVENEKGEIEHYELPMDDDQFSIMPRVRIKR